MDLGKVMLGSLQAVGVYPLTLLLAAIGCKLTAFDDWSEGARRALIITVPVVHWIVVTLLMSGADRVARRAGAAAACLQILLVHLRAVGVLSAW